MIREIYFRDPSDPKFRSDRLETSSELEMLLNQIRMILLTNKGEVLGSYYLGLDLEKYLFEFGFNEGQVKKDFLTQVSQYIKNTRYKIDMTFDYSSDGVKDIIYLYITVDDQRVLGISI